MSPEEEELQTKRDELERLTIQLSERELELTTLRAELDAFHRRYMRVVGSRYAQLDSLEAEVARLNAVLHPRDNIAQTAAQQARSRAEESAKQLHDTPVDAGAPDFTPSADLKKLYKQATRKLHPDLAADDEEKARRAQFMVEANLAYEAGDEARLRAVLDEWGASPENIIGTDTAAELVRTIRKIAQVRRRLVQIDAEIAEARTTDLHRMKDECDSADCSGRDPLNDLAGDLDREIEATRTQLELLRKTAST